MTTDISSLDWIGRLISLDTTSRNSNLPLIDLVADRLADHGASVSIRPNGAGDKANLIATIPAADGSTDGGLVLSGHTDVVPVDGQEWTSDPFALAERDGKLYGRGIADMKGFIGVALSMVPRMLETPLHQPIHFALSYDEEVGLFGGAQMVDDFAQLNLTPSRCIVGEPTGMRVIGTHKSFDLVQIVVRGRDGHSSLAPNFVSAAFYGAKIISFVQDLAEEFQLKGPFDDGYDVPFSTISVNHLVGGSLGNTVPAECRIRLDFRTISEVDPRAVMHRIRERAADIEAVMRSQDPTTGIDVSTVAVAPGLEASAGSDLAGMLAAAGARNDGDKMAGATEAGFFHSMGIDTVVCGPGHIAQAHVADEFVTVDQIVTCEKVLGTLVDSLGKDSK